MVIKIKIRRSGAGTQLSVHGRIASSCVGEEETQVQRARARRDNVVAAIYIYIGRRLFSAFDH